jgi:glycosyl transferase family 87
VVAALLIGGLLATSAFVAASLRLESAVSALLAGYIVLVAETAALTAGLSPLHAVTRGGLTVSETALLAAAAGAWWLRGRPGFPLAAARTTAARALRDPLVVAFIVVVAAALAYELLLVVAAPPNNWDSLTYHLARAALWAQHGGVYWVPNAPTDRINEFQPLADQEVFYLFVATGKSSLFALPQFVALLATIAAIYATARRLGYGLRPAACAALLFGTFTIVALEATTSQNDLVAASLPAAAVALLLARGSPELMLAGVAAGLAVGVKLTTALVFPVLILLAALRGRRAVVFFGYWALASFAVFSSWSFVENAVKTGHLLGRGGGRVELAASPSFPGSVSTGMRVLYRMTDLPGFHNRTIWALAALAAIAAAAGLAVGLRRGRLEWGLAGLPLLAPALALGLAGAIQLLVRLVHLPINPPATTSQTFFWTVNRLASEDFAGYGPLGIVLLAVIVVTIVAVLRRRADARHLALSLALPMFLMLVVMEVRYYDFLTRFLLVPVALTTPLAAVFFRRAGAGAAILVVAAITVTLALDRDLVKPFNSAYGHPWQLSLSNAVRLNWKPAAGEALGELDQDAGDAAVGAVLGRDEPSYLLFGETRNRRVTFLPPLPEHAVRAAKAAQLPFVVVGDVPGIADAFVRAGWRLQSLGIYWTLAIAP